MRQMSRGVVVALLALAATIAADDAAARTIRRLCRDGVIANGSGRLTTACDVDHECDGTCSFELPVCDATTCQTHTFTVPARTTRPERVALTPGGAPAKLMLRCRPTPRSLRCIPPATTTTTTIGGPTTTTQGDDGGHIPLQTTTTVRLVRATTTSTTSSTSTSSIVVNSTTTSTSLAPVPCQNDFDCDGFSSACAIAFCGLRDRCEQACVCLSPDHERTCDLDEAATCLTPADCPRTIGDACRVCYLNRCVTAPGPGCF